MTEKEILRAPLYPSSSGNVYLLFPEIPGHAWCDIQFIECKDGTGLLRFFTAYGGQAGDLSHFLRYEDTPQNPTPVLVDTIDCYTLVLAMKDVDALFGNQVIDDMWMNWTELFLNFDLNFAPDYLIRALNIIYDKMNVEMDLTKITSM
jgi:hypothetical protein